MGSFGGGDSPGMLNHHLGKLEQASDLDVPPSDANFGLI